MNEIWKDAEKYVELLEQENEKIKKQYNCYACGNCKGKEDYINLEKHHKGLRKQFDEFVKRNHTLSLRIEELEQENKELKEYEYYYLDKFLELKQALEEIRDYCDEQNLKADYTACYITNKIDEVLNDN